MIRPADFVRRFADPFRSPVAVYENSAVQTFERQGTTWLVKTDHGEVAAGKVILAVNGHAQSFGLQPGRLMHVFTYASLTQASDPARLGGQRDWATTPALPMGTTIRRLSGATGGGSWCAPAIPITLRSRSVPQGWSARAACLTANWPAVSQALPARLCNTAGPVPWC